MRHSFYIPEPCFYNPTLMKKLKKVEEKTREIMREERFKKVLFNMIVPNFWLIIMDNNCHNL